MKSLFLLLALFLLLFPDVPALEGNVRGAAERSGPSREQLSVALEGTLEESRAEHSPESPVREEDQRQQAAPEARPEEKEASSSRAMVLSQVPGHVESDTVVCRKNKNICSTLLCPMFYTVNGTCYDGKQKCCVRWSLKNMLPWFRKENQQ
uniref:Beta-defensin 1 isoform X2 n=1 Tax=Pogona vitticeps TaxID=103695 RepID=A0ABM5GRQ4_9SAUR